MLINAQRPEELRVAIVSGTTLEGYQVDVAASGLTRGNIYRGVIANIQPSLNAAFIDYGTPRHGFLSIQDVVPQAYYKDPSGSHPRIEEVLEKNKPIVVQVAKDAVGDKGASLTTNLSLAGRYLVLTPFDDTRGVSRKVEDEDVRKKLRQLAGRLELPDGSGVIVRTNALEQTKLTLQRDLAALLRLWKRVQSEATRRGQGTRLLYDDQDLIVQALRDQLDAGIEEVLVDDDDAFERAVAYMQAFMPRGRTRLVRYADRLPLFSRYDLEAQLERIHERRVSLPSGGSIVIDPTEALTAIDVNSGRSTRAATQEETAVHTNLEAAREVARQLRLRDIGGLVVVDFIDMRASKNQRKVEKGLRDAMKDDKARSTVGRISGNGLLEINRQRIRQPLALRTHRSCPTCGGSGTIASPEMVSLALLRRIEARAATGRIAAVKVGLHPELADALQNERRHELAALEREFDLKIEIAASPGLHRAEEKVDWTNRDKPRPLPPPKAEARVFNTADLALDEEEEEEPAPEVAAGAPATTATTAREGRGERTERREGGRGGRERGERGRRERGGRERGGRERGARGERRESGETGERRDRGQREAGGAGDAGSTGDHREKREPHEGTARPVEAAGGEGETQEGIARKKKRRRGGRKRKKGAGEAAAAAGAEGLPSGEGGEATASGELMAPADRDAFASANRRDWPADADENEDAEEAGEPGAPFEPSATETAGEEPGGNGVRRKRRRGRRRRKRAGEPGAPGAEAAPGEGHEEPESSSPASFPPEVADDEG